MPTKKTARVRVDCEKFYVDRRRAGLTHKQAAEMLRVTTRTIRNWENGTSEIPYAAFRLMRLFAGHSLLPKKWEDWSIWQGVLYSPSGRGFEPYQLDYLGNYLWMARQWLKEREDLKPDLANARSNPKFATKPLLRVSEARKAFRQHSLLGFRSGDPSGATAPLGSQGRQVNDGLSLKVVGLQEKNKSGKYYHFGSIGDAANDVLELEVK